MATKASSERSHTTVTVRKETYERLKRLKPYDSMSYNEVINIMADAFVDGDDGGTTER